MTGDAHGPSEYGQGRRPAGHSHRNGHRSDALAGRSRPAQSVNWYKIHSDGRHNMVDHCVVQADDNTDCITAKQAEFELSGIRP